MVYNSFRFNNETDRSLDPRRILLRYIPVLIKRRERKEKLFEIIEASEDTEDSIEAFEKLRTAVKISRTSLEIFEYSELSFANLRLKSKALGLKVPSVHSKFSILFGIEPGYSRRLDSEQEFYTDPFHHPGGLARSVWGDYNHYLESKSGLLNSEYGKESLYHYLGKKYNTNIDYPARTSSCYDYDEEIYEFIAGLMHEKYNGNDQYLAMISAQIIGKRGDIRAKDRITHYLSESGADVDYRKKLQDMLRGIEKIQRKEQASFISEKGRDLFKP